METCANPGCDQPGTNKCAGCKTIPYCGPICQTAHWPTHKESCDGRLRKMGMDHLNKASGFQREQNWPQMLRHSDLAATKLKQLKDRPIEAISDALELKCIALGFLGRFREQLESAKEWYCLWNTKPTDMGAINAAFALIDTCMHNNEYADAYLYASTLYEIINHKYDNKIPYNIRQQYIAEGAYYLATATLRLAKDGGIPPAEKQKAGQEAIALARKALEIYTQLLGAVCDKTATAMGVLAEALDFFNDNCDDEALRLFQQSKAIHTRLFGNVSVNVAVNLDKLGAAYIKRSQIAHDTNDLDLEQELLELALPTLVESARIYRAINQVDDADRVTRNAVIVEELLQIRAAAAAAAAAATKG